MEIVAASEKTEVFPESNSNWSVEIYMQALINLFVFILKWGTER